MKRFSTIQDSEDTRLLVRYLLDDLSEGEQERVEDRYAADKAFFAKLLVAEDELIDSYVLGDISHDNRSKFEQVYLTNPHRRKKVESNKVILELVENTLLVPPFYQRFIGSLRRTFSSRRMNLAYSLAGLLLVATFGSLIWRSFAEKRRLQNELEQVKAGWNRKEEQYKQQLATLNQPKIDSQSSPASRDKPEPLKEDKKRESLTGPRPSTIATFALQGSGLIRNANGTALKSLVIQRGVALLKLKVDLVANDYSDYRVSLQRVEGQDVWSGTIAADRTGLSSKKLVIDLPVSLLKHRDYILKVTGSDAPDQILAFHHISVINKNFARPVRDEAVR
jgi:hypothetical protein